MEYVCAIWDPHLSKDILAFGNTQKFALRVCLKIGELTRRKFLNYACSSTSSQGRLHIMIPHLLGSHHPTLTDSRTLYNSSSTCQSWLYFKYSLSPSSIETWNFLHFDVASKKSLLSFKNVSYITSWIHSLDLVLCCCLVLLVLFCKVYRLTLAWYS